jgi:hypothetical protein
MKISSRLIIVTVIFTTTSLISGNLINWRIGFEGGLYRYKITSLSSENHLLSRFHGSLQIQSASAHNRWSLSFQIKPERYSNSHNYSAIKVFSKGYYQKTRDIFNWGVGYDARQYEYSISPQHLSLTTFKLNGHAAWILHPDWILTLYPVYYYRDISSQVTRKLDALSLEINLNRPFSWFWQVSGGWYLENFYVEDNIFPDINIINNKNKGFRSGPVISADYKKKYILSVRYLLLLHHSRLSRFPSFEHYFRFFAGTVFYKSWTLLFYMDYYWNYIKLKGNINTPLLYLPADSENRIELKLEKILQDKFILFSRFGFFRDRLYWENYATRGWQFTLGLEYNH